MFMEKLDVIQFWFMEWLIKEKKITMTEYEKLSEQEYEQLHKDFLVYYNSIQ